MRLIPRHDLIVALGAAFLRRNLRAQAFELFQPRIVLLGFVSRQRAIFFRRHIEQRFRVQMQLVAFGFENFQHETYLSRSGKAAELGRREILNRWRAQGSCGKHLAGNCSVPATRSASPVALRALLRLCLRRSVGACNRAILTQSLQLHATRSEIEPRIVRRQHDRREHLARLGHVADSRRVLHRQRLRVATAN